MLSSCSRALDDAEAEEEGTKKGEERNKRHDAADDSDDDGGLEDVVSVDVDGDNSGDGILRARFWGLNFARACW